MIKSAIGAVAALLAFSGAGVAGELFVNPEFNGSAGADTGFGAASLDGHIGYQFDNGVSVQAGPVLLIPDSGESEIEFSGKVNVGSGPLSWFFRGRNRGAACQGGMDVGCGAAG